MHVADPHFALLSYADTPLEVGDFLLLDSWGPANCTPDAIYGDITWVGYAGPQIPPRIEQVFELVRQARATRPVVFAASGSVPGRPCMATR